MSKKPTILYVSDSCKVVDEFLSEIIYDLDELNVPILNADRRRFTIETEHYKLRGFPIHSNDSLWLSFEYKTHFLNGTVIYQGLSLEKVLYRLRPNVKEITNRNEILKLLSEGKL